MPPKLSRIKAPLFALWFVIAWAVICFVPWHQHKPGLALLPLGTPYVNERLWGRHTLDLLVIHCVVSVLVAVVIEVTRLAWRRLRAGETTPSN